jgi:lipoprotein-anchoring transpeptidase ErfK/SrfK
MTYEPSHNELHNIVPKPSEGAPLDPRCMSGEALCIDKSTSSLRYVVDGEVQMEFDVRFGSELTPTDEGQFAVEWKSEDHVSSLYDTPMPYAMFFSGGQAVHYSSDFATYGYGGASHGCVNVRDYDAIATLFDLVDVGDTVVVYWS